MDNKHDFIKDLLIVILFFGAVGLIAYGLSLIFRPIMWIFLGAAAVYLASGLSRSKGG